MIQRSLFQALVLCLLCAGVAYGFDAHQRVIIDDGHNGAPLGSPENPMNFNGDGGVSGAISIGNGADAAKGATTNTPCTYPTSAAPATEISLWKCLINIALTPPLPYGFTPLTPGQHGVSITSATALTVPATATYATLCARNASLNYTTDGTTTPTASVGQPLGAAGCVGLSGAALLANAKLISAAGTFDVEYFK